MKDQTPLSDEGLGRLLVRLAIPAMLSQLITLAYNMVDRIYIGHIDDGALSMTGIGVCLPIVTIIIAVVSLFGRGGAPLSGISLGAGKNDDADELLSNSLMLIAIAAAAIFASVQIWAEPILRLFGASDATLPYAEGYLRIYSLGCFFFMPAMGLNYFINTQGLTRIGMMTPLIGGVINIILDPLFIFGLGLGVKGAALATVISQFFSFLWVLRFFRGPLALIHVRRRFLRLKGAIVGRICMLGSAPAFMNATEGLLLMCFNMQLSRYGGDTALACMTIFATIFQLLLLPMIGIYQGAQPIVSYNYGAGNIGRVTRAIKYAGTATVAYSLLVTAAVTAAPAFFVRLFTDDPAVITAAPDLLRTYLCGAAVLGLTIVSQDTYNALGDGKLSLFFAFLRKGMLLIPLIYLLPLGMDDKVFAVIAAEPLSDFTASILSGIYFVFYAKRKFSASDGRRPA